MKKIIIIICLLCSITSTNRSLRQALAEGTTVLK